jgi:hypothetical protein
VKTILIRLARELGNDGRLTYDEAGGAGNSKADGRTVIKTARAAKRLWDDFTASHLADRIISRAWQKVAR